MAKKVIIYSIITIILSSCAAFLSQKQIIEFNNEYQEIILLDSKAKSVHGLYFSIYGKLDGETEIEYGDGSFFKKIIISKDNNTYTYNADYYSNILIFKIYPKSSEKRQLKIKYYFRNIL